MANNKEMKVSIVVPINNVVPYIEHFARSIFGQTLEDVENVFVDDCTPNISIKLLSIEVQFDYLSGNIIEAESSLWVTICRIM